MHGREWMELCSTVGAVIVDPFHFSLLFYYLSLFVLAPFFLSQCRRRVPMSRTHSIGEQRICMCLLKMRRHLFIIRHYRYDSGNK